MHKIDFAAIEWNQIADGAREKVWSDGSRRLRLLELDDTFFELDWCTKPHLGYVIEGTLEVDFDGTVETFTPGDGIAIQENEPHKARADTPVVKISFLEN